MFQRSVPTSSNLVLRHSLMYIYRDVPVKLEMHHFHPTGAPLLPRFGISGFSGIYLAAAVEHNACFLLFCTFALVPGSKTLLHHA